MIPGSDRFGGSGGGWLSRPQLSRPPPPSPAEKVGGVENSRSFSMVRSLSEPLATLPPPPDFFRKKLLILQRPPFSRPLRADSMWRTGLVRPWRAGSIWRIGLPVQKIHIVFEYESLFSSILYLLLF